MVVSPGYVDEHKDNERQSRELQVWCSCKLYLVQAHILPCWRCTAYWLRLVTVRGDERMIRGIV